MDEVSTVDSPANEREFLILKNMEDSNMGDSATETQGTPAEAGSDAQRVTLDVPAADGEAVAKAMEHVSSIVDSIADLAKSAATAPVAADDDDGDEPDDSADAGDETEEAGTEKGKMPPGAGGGAGKFPRGLFKQMLQKAGIQDAGALKLLLDGLSKQFESRPPAGGQPPLKGGMKPGMKTGMKPGMKTAKAADEPEATPVTLEMLQKAAVFTPERVAALQSAFETLKMVIEAISPGQSPATRTPSTTQFGASGVRELANPIMIPTVKNEGGDEPEGIIQLAQTLKSIGDTLQILDGRVQAIEKARPPSNSVEGDGGTDSTQQTQKSLWAGVL